MSLRRLFVAIAVSAASLLGACAPGISPDALNALSTTKFQPVGAGGDAVKLAVH